MIKVSRDLKSATERKPKDWLAGETGFHSEGSEQEAEMDGEPESDSDGDIQAE